MKKISIKSKRAGLTVVAFMLLIFLHSLEILNPIEKTIFNFFAPIQKNIYSFGLGIKDTVETIKYKNNLTETEILKAQIRSLTLQNAKLKILGEENKILKKELGFSKTNEYDLVGARVIGYDSLHNSTLLILELEDDNVNLDDIKIGMPVVVEDGILVGKISNINQNKLFIQPLISSESAIASTILNSSYTTGIIEGELNLAIKMKMIPQTEKIKAGDLIITSGLEAEIPKGLLIGTVTKVSYDSLSPFQIAHITPLIDFTNLSNVLIIKKY